MPRSINLIVIHCSASPDGRPVSVETIRQWHRARGFTDIGYHWVVGVTGQVYPGRPEESVGAHAKGHNAKSLGICMVGTERFPLHAWASLKAKIEQLLERFPGASVCGHRDLSPDLDGDGQVEPNEWIKICPGFDVAAWLQRGMMPDSKHVLEAAHD